MLRRWRTAVIALLLAGTWESMLLAQGFQPRGKSRSSTDSSPTQIPGDHSPLRRPAVNQEAVHPSTEPAVQAQTSSSVSQDLLQIYAQTQAARSEADVTGIARACARVVTESTRSKEDQTYAASLLAWALNRRGEMRSEQAEGLVRAGRLESASKLDSQAADDFAIAVQYAPNSWRHRHNYAVSLAMKGDYSKALEQLDRAIELNPDYANARFNRAELQFQQGAYEAAERDYSAAIELSEDAQYVNSRAHCRFLMGSYEQAIADYRRATELPDKNAVYLTDLGDACQFLGQWETAAQAYRDSVAVDNRYPRAYQNAAWLMATCPDERIRNTELALSAAKKAIELTGKRTAENVETLAAAIAALGRYPEAVRLQEEAVVLAGRQSNVPESHLEELRQRLTLYQSQQAYLQPTPGLTESSKNLTRTASAPGR